MMPRHAQALQPSASQVGDSRRPLSTCALSKDGSVIATGSWSGLVRVRCVVLVGRVRAQSPHPLPVSLACSCGTGTALHVSCCEAIRSVCATWTSTPIVCRPPATVSPRRWCVPALHQRLRHRFTCAAMLTRVLPPTRRSNSPPLAPTLCATCGHWATRAPSHHCEGTRHGWLACASTRPANSQPRRASTRRGGCGTWRRVSAYSCRRGTRRKCTRLPCTAMGLWLARVTLEVSAACGTCAPASRC